MTDNVFSHSRIRELLDDDRGFRWSKEAIEEMDGMLQVIVYECGVIAQEMAEKEEMKTVMGHHILDAYHRYEILKNR